ncbi:MAG: 2-oxoacid:acceptor oxidoreductase family protein [Elusimicrobia bacterium]|nr:2-oxoacid:acceptor oxidoreductase family protein [Elusimicrobiota bacterium]MBU2615319.1 2-oxoacid:acceptor oxidoreductase family protein [Elusimicrobiota bacterium]
MKDEIFIAGAGGQGILALGKILAESAVEQGKFVTFYPSYGAEIRGGTTNCTVIISDEEIGSPTISCANSLIIMNTPSLVKFLPKLTSNGVLIINSSLIDISQEARDLKNRISGIFQIPATAIAQELGDIRCANMVMLGAYTGVKKIISSDSVSKAINNTFSKKPELVKLNIEAYKKGISGVKPL